MKYAFIIIALLLASCYDNSEYLFDEENATPISVVANMGFTKDTLSVSSKIDTISTTDSILFWAQIYPSKNIRMQKYLWTIDKFAFASEFTFRRAITSAGAHTIAFILIDAFGDTISDTLHLWVSKQPVLDTNKIIPKRGSQQISTGENISFAWEGHDPDSLYKLHYLFRLYDENKKILVDSVLTENHFTYKKALSPLSRYDWSVIAYNELNAKSKDSIQSFFYTSGLNNSSGLFATVNFSSINTQNQFLLFKNVNIYIADSANKIIYTKSTETRSNKEVQFNISPLKPGKYKIFANIDNYPDYISDTTSIELLPEKFAEIPTIMLKDVNPPTIKCIGACFDNTVNHTDTLKFLIKDYGGINPWSVQLTLDMSPLGGASINGDTLFVLLPTNTKDWISHTLNILIKDISDNEISTLFEINPRDLFFTANHDTTIYDGDSLQIFIKYDTDIPYQIYYFDVYVNNTEFFYRRTQSKGQEMWRYINYSDLPDSVNTMQTEVSFAYNIKQKYNWKITRIFQTRN